MEDLDKVLTASVHHVHTHLRAEVAGRSTDQGRCLDLPASAAQEMRRRQRRCPMGSRGRTTTESNGYVLASLRQTPGPNQPHVITDRTLKAQWRRHRPRQRFERLHRLGIREPGYTPGCEA